MVESDEARKAKARMRLAAIAAATLAAAVPLTPVAGAERPESTTVGEAKLAPGQVAKKKIAKKQKVRRKKKRLRAEPPAAPRSR